MALEEFDVLVHVGKGLFPLRRPQPGVRDGAVAVALGVVGIEPDGPGRVFDASFGSGVGAIVQAFARWRQWPA